MESVGSFFNKAKQEIVKKITRHKKDQQEISLPVECNLLIINYLIRSVWNDINFYVNYADYPVDLPNLYNKAYKEICDFSLLNKKIKKIYDDYSQLIFGSFISNFGIKAFPPKSINYKELAKALSLIKFITTRKPLCDEVAKQKSPGLLSGLKIICGNEGKVKFFINHHERQVHLFFDSEFRREITLFFFKKVFFLRKLCEIDEWQTKSKNKLFPLRFDTRQTSMALGYSGPSSLIDIVKLLNDLHNNPLKSLE